MNSSRPKGRPAKALVSREKIASAALEIIAEAGYERLTMARIARHMGVGTSALYNHVEGKHELLILVEDAVMSKVDVALLDAALAGATTPADALAAWAWSYREVFSAHAPLVEIIAATPVSGAPRTVAMYEKVARVFALGGVAEPEILPRIIMLESFIYGSVYDVAAPPDIFAVPAELAAAAPTLRRSRSRWLERLEAAGPRASSPAAQAPESGAAERNPFADEPFLRGVRALLAGLSEEDLREEG